jgi:hypothetical protein
MMWFATSNRIMNNSDNSLYSSHTHFFQTPIEISQYVSVYLIFDTGCRRSVAIAMRLYTVPCVFMRSLSRIIRGEECVEVFQVKTG